MKEGVSLITGDPKKAIMVLSVPMIIAMLLTSSYNLISAIWVSGLGGDALAAVGFVSPVFMILIGLSNGLGAGATSAISRCIGAKNKRDANNSAVHTLILTVIISIIVTVLLEVFLVPILQVLGAGDTVDLAVEFARPLFLCTILLLFANAAYGILRAEGDAKRTMYAMGIAAIMNMVLDPVLIYGLNMGIAGAAWGTVISQAFVAAIILYWFFVKKDTYVTLKWESFTPSRKITGDLLGVGIPASVEFFVMAALGAVLNLILMTVAGTDAVAAYTSAWRVVMMGIVPIIAVSIGTVAVVGASFGARKYTNIDVAHKFAIEIGLVVAVVTAVIIYFGATFITMLFTYSAETTHLTPTIAACLQVMCVFFLAVPFGIMSSSVFQGTGKGMTSLVLTVLREGVFAAISAYILAMTLGFGEQGVWWGIVAGNVLGSIVAFAWARFFIGRLKRLE